MGMGVVPEQAWWMIARNLHRVVQSLAGHSHHSEHVVLWCARRNREPMKMQVRHVHAGIHRTGLRGLRRQVVDVRDSESVPRGSADDRRHRLSLESEGIQAIFIHRVKRERYKMILRPHLRRLRHRNSLREAISCKKYLRTEEHEPRAFSLSVH